MTKPNHSASRPACPWELLLTLLLLSAGLLLRVAYAWATRTISEPDPAVVALMANHMATLQDFPIFFYGQSYMGSLEPAVSALFVALLGPTGFAVNLGVAAVSFLALLALVRWGRDAIGRWGGAAALLGAILGPAAYFKFQTAARGGYMVALAIDAAVLVLAAKMAADLWTTDSVRKRDFAALGLLAGLGIWSNMIVAAALATAALLVLVGMRGRFWRYWKAIGTAVLAVMLGALPLLLHIARCGLDVLNVSRIGAHAPLRVALLHAWTRWLQCQAGDPPNAITPLAVALAVLPLLLALLGIWAAWRRRREMSVRQRFAAAAAILFCGAFLAVYVLSGFPQVNAPRYLIPLVPGLAILDGMALAFAFRATRRRALAWAAGLLAALLAAALLVLQALANAPAFPAAEETSRQAAAGYDAIAEALAASGADALLAPNQLYPLNFALQEKVPCSDGRQEFCPAIRRAAELAVRPAYHRSWLGIEALLDSIRAPSTLYPGGIVADVRPPARPPLAEMARLATSILPVPDSTQTICRIELPVPAPAVPWSLQPFFHTFVDGPLCGWIASISVDAVVPGPADANAETLVPVAGPVPLVPIEWSICRAYRSPALAPEILLAPLPPGASALRIVLDHKRRAPAAPSWELLDVLLFAGDLAASAPPPAPGLLLDALSDALARHPALPLLAERHLSTQLLARGEPRDRLPTLSTRLFPVDPRQRIAAWESVEVAQFPLDGSPFLVCVENRLRPAMDRLLAAQGIPYETSPLAPTHQLLRILPYTPSAPPAALTTDTPVPCLLAP